ncbi:DUF5752 family protein [Photobacterium leiognathi]|uniref:DUF5752 family protein n=1 Tax=Photobacterium leiognathi TaxID=553611 RepID=UPI00387EA19E
MHFGHKLLLEIDRAREQENSFSTWVKQACRNELIAKNLNDITTRNKESCNSVRLFLNKPIGEQIDIRIQP